MLVMGVDVTSQVTPPSYNAEYGPVFGSDCQNKQTEHIIRPISSVLFSYRYDSFKVDSVQRLGNIGLYADRPVRCVPLSATHCRLRLTWSREQAL
ncbi:transposable element Tcb1 transposase [Trichonephila clavipes]|nr:transposable element Tcb1 transposase [Trichonephila clavipes]